VGSVARDDQQCKRTAAPPPRPSGLSSTRLAGLRAMNVAYGNIPSERRVFLFDSFLSDWRAAMNVFKNHLFFPRRGLPRSRRTASPEKNPPGPTKTGNGAAASPDPLAVSAAKGHFGRAPPPSTLPSRRQNLSACGWIGRRWFRTDSEKSKVEIPKYWPECSPAPQDSYEALAVSVGSIHSLFSGPDFFPICHKPVLQTI